MVQYICLVVQRCTIRPAPCGNLQLEPLIGGSKRRGIMKLRIAGVLVGATVLATACGGGGSSGTPVAQPPVSSPPVVSATPTPTPTPTPTVAPMKRLTFYLASSGGYTETATLDVGKLQHFSS